MRFISQDLVSDFSEKVGISNPGEDVESLGSLIFTDIS